MDSNSKLPDQTLDEVDDDLDLLDESNDLEAMWNSKLVAMASQPSCTGNDNTEPVLKVENKDSPFDENQEKRVEEDVQSAANSDVQIRLWTFSDSHSMGLGPKPDVIASGEQGSRWSPLHTHPPTAILPDVINSGQMSTSDKAAVSMKNHGELPHVPLSVFYKTTEELEDYSDSDAETIPSSPEKTTGIKLYLKRTYKQSSFCMSSDNEEDSGTSSQREVYNIVDQPRATVTRKLSPKPTDTSDDSPRPFPRKTSTIKSVSDVRKLLKPKSYHEPPTKVLRISSDDSQDDVELSPTKQMYMSDDSASPRKTFFVNPEARKLVDKKSYKSPTKLIRISSDDSQGDSELSPTKHMYMSDDSASPRKTFFLNPEARKLVDKKKKSYKSPTKLIRLSSDDHNSQKDSELLGDGDLQNTGTFKYEEPNTETRFHDVQTAIKGKLLKGSKGPSAVGSQSRDDQSCGAQYAVSTEDIDKVIEWFPDASRDWIQRKIESAKKQKILQYMDYVVDSMVDGNYHKVSCTIDKTKEPDVIIALGNNQIQSSRQAGDNRTVSGAGIRLYGKKCNYTGGAKGKGKATIPKKPVRNVLDEMESSEDEKDIGMDAGEYMDILRDNEVSSSSLTCESCKMNRNTDMVVQCCEGHLICNSCVEKEVKEILSPDSQETQIRCPSENCSSKVPESQAKKILPNLIIELLEEKLHKQAVESISKMEDLVTCPNCSFPVLMDADIKQFECPSCKKSSCRFCKRLWVMTSHLDCNQFTTFLQENLDSKDLEPPSYWYPMAEEGDEDYVIVVLEKKCVEFQHIKTLFSHSISSSRIRAVRRIQNPRLWQKFCLARKHMVEDFGQNNLNEKQLFHGTNPKAFDAICREGLDWRMCGENGTAFGQGTYFAKRASYSDRYSPVTSGCGNASALSLQSSSAAFAQAFNLPSSFPAQPQNPFQLTHQPSANPANVIYGNVQQQNPNSGNVFRTSSNIFPSNSTVRQGTFGVGLLNTHMPVNMFGPSNISSPQGIFGPASNNGQGMFGPANNGNQGVFGPSNSSNQGLFGPDANSQSVFGPSTASNALAVFQGQTPTPTVSNSKVTSTTDKVVFTNVEEVIHRNRKYMFVARTLVGRTCRGQHDIRKPPSDPDDPKRRPFNSCVDHVLTPQIFVIFDSAQSYPEYLIEYTS